MDTKLIERNLERLNDMRAQAYVIRMRYEDVRRTIVPAEIQQQLDDLDAEYKMSVEALNGGIGEIEAEIKADVIAYGATVKGGGLMAVWNKGRVTWDSKLLDGYAVAHPEILAARKEGDPSVTIIRTAK